MKSTRWAVGGLGGVLLLAAAAPLRAGEFEGDGVGAPILRQLHRPVAIFTVAFAPKGGHKLAMTQLADENVGRYEAPEI